ncbi:TPA: amino acid permease [Bacillus pseudomycoides]|nr:amino acid permease [Bacillus pseudomycoides]
MIQKEKQSNELKRTMQSRHLFMIALGGVIGTGLFMGSGQIVHNAGPGGAILAYLVGGFVMYLTMLCLGELTVAMPEAGSFQSYSSKFISPGFGFVVGWMYWLNWAVTVGVELTTVSILMKRWFPDVASWIWCVVFAAILFIVNASSARAYAETEFWFASVKVMTIIVFILLGGAVMLGLLDFNGKPAPMFHNFTENGGLFPNGLPAVLFTMITVNFAFQGTELIGIASGESKQPEITIPRAIKNTIWRTLFFFVLAITVVVGLLPWQEANLVESPFVLVFDTVGIPYAADIMNFVIITAVLSVANSGLYANSRMLWAMSKQGMGSPRFTKLTKKGVPINALIFSLIFAGLSLLTSVFAADTVFLVLTSIAAMAAVVVWMSIAASQFFFRREFIKNGGDIRDLKYRTPLYPLVPIAAFSLNFVTFISLAFIPDQRIALYCGIPFMITCYIFYKVKYKKIVTFEQQKNVS